MSTDTRTSDPIIPPQGDIETGSMNEQKKRLTLQQLAEKLAKEKEGVGSEKVGNLSVDEQDKIKSGSE